MEYMSDHSRDQTGQEKLTNSALQLEGLGLQLKDSTANKNTADLRVLKEASETIDAKIAGVMAPIVRRAKLLDASGQAMLMAAVKDMQGSQYPAYDLLREQLG